MIRKKFFDFIGGVLGGILILWLIVSLGNYSFVWLILPIVVVGVSGYYFKNWAFAIGFVLLFICAWAMRCAGL
jgi:hypothetical protein